MARNVHNKTSRYLSHGCTYAFFPLVHGRGYLRYWKNLALQLATLEVSNQSYKSMDYSKLEFTIEWQTHHLELRTRLQIQFYDIHLNLILAQKCS